MNLGRGVHNMRFGEKLLALRKENKLSQEELASLILVSRQAISRWESGNSMPDAENIIQICKVFNVSTDYLLNDEYESDSDIPAVRGISKKTGGIIRIVCGAGLSILGIVGIWADYMVKHIIGSMPNTYIVNEGIITPISIIVLILGGCLAIRGIYKAKN